MRPGTARWATPAVPRVPAVLGHRQTGRFTRVGLSPGRYHAVAVNYLQSGAERDSSILERLAAQARSLTLGEGGSRDMDFRIVDRY